MKSFIICLTIFLAGCTTQTEHGKCIGAFDDKDPTLTYKVNAWNIFLGVIGFELIAPPIFVIIDSTFCPVSKK